MNSKISLVIICSIIVTSCSTIGNLFATPTPSPTITPTPSFTPTISFPTVTPSATQPITKINLDFYGILTGENWSAFIDYFYKTYPGINITSSWNEGDCFSFCSESSILTQRFQNGDQPDVLISSIGFGFNKHMVSKGFMEPYSEINGNNTLNLTYPKGFLELVSYEGQLWAAPSGINRINLLWYNKTIFEQNGIQPSDVESFEGFEKVAKKLQKAGIIPLAVSDQENWRDANLFGVVLAGSMSPNQYKGLWTGDTDWKGPEVAQSLKNYQMVMKYANADHTEITWDEFMALFTEGKAAMAIQPSWHIGDLRNRQFTDYGWTTPPGTKGVFVFHAWGMGSPKGSHNPDEVRQLQNAYASKQGSEIFLEKVEVILCARKDCDYSADTDPFRQYMNQDWQTDILLPSLLWDTATDSDWHQKIIIIIEEFMRTGNIPATQKALLQACADAGPCKK